MDVKEEILSLKKEIETIKKENKEKEELKRQLNIIKKRNKALLKSLIFMLVAFFILLFYTLKYFY